MCQQLRAQANAQDRLALTQRGFDRQQFGLEMRVSVLVLHIHRAAEHNQAVITLDVGLRLGMTLEIVEANAMAARSDAGVQCAQRLRGHMLEDHQTRHVAQYYADAAPSRQSQVLGSGAEETGRSP